MPRWVPERIDGEGWLLLFSNGFSLLVMGKQGFEGIIIAWGIGHPEIPQNFATSWGPGRG